MKPLRKGYWAAAALVLALLAGLATGPLVASDHDDGETDTKGRNVNLTDLYAFREGDQTGTSADNSNLILIMNTNPRSVARQQYYFSNRARYEFHLDRIRNVNSVPAGHTDILLRFEFDAPGDGNRQRMTVTLIRDGVTTQATLTTGGQRIRTTPLGETPHVNMVSLGGATLGIFAGLREDPFFFDVEQFFRVRAGAAGLGPSVVFRDPGLDFTAGYNVNAIVVRLPLSVIQGSGVPFKVFDVWETVSYPDANNVFVQIERLGRPAINEGLLLTNAYLNALNSIGPDCEAAALNGIDPCASAAAPIVAEAKATLMAVGNTSAQADALLTAFLPDVMRTDTSGASGYANALNTLGSPVRGRKIMDDVIDITLSVIVPGTVPALESDHVSYAGPNLGSTGHKPLSSTFPFLAAPN